MSTLQSERLIFGTDGIRGRVGEFPIKPQALYLLGQAIGSWLIERYGPSSTILIGYDTRASCESIKQFLCAGIQRYPLLITDGGILSTPSVYTLMQANSIYTAGIVISASHNPHYDNGIKLFDYKTCKLSSDEENEICQRFTWLTNKYTHSSPDITNPVSDKHVFTSAASEYCSIITSHFPSSMLTGIRVVLDCAHGATTHLALPIFRAMGATIVTTIGTNPNGININEGCGSLYPEKLQQMVRSCHADIGFAFDGDGDRVIAVNYNGTVCDGDALLGLLSTSAMFRHEQAIVGTILTNGGLEYFLHQSKRSLIRTPVGDKHIIQALVHHKLNLGGEPSGHIILRNYSLIGDGILAALEVIRTALETNNWIITPFIKNPQKTINIPVSRKQDLQQHPYCDIINDHRNRLSTYGRVVVRYSGTEPVLRILVEDMDVKIAQTVAEHLTSALHHALISVQGT